ncbi:MAG TPA: ribosome silencing factor [Candidatus Acidoferrales bacterium]|nr:ribosome silencing factor [Candidatus Acidoferrales bacterium]
MTANKDSIPPHVRAAIDAAQEKQAAEVVLLDLAGLGAFTDYFLICTGFSGRQVEAICEEIEQRLARIGTRLLHREGKAGGDWMLLDFGALIVHVFTERARRFYDLERLWRAARRFEFGDPHEASSVDGAAEAEG